MATIRERGGSWHVQIRLKGFPPVTETFARKTDAKRWAESTEAAMRDRRWFPEAVTRGKTVADAIDRYVSEVLARRTDAVPTVGPQLRWWRDELGAYELSTLTGPRIVEGRDKLARTKARGKTTPLSPATVNRYLAALSAVLTAAVKDWGWLAASPMARVRKMKEPTGRVRFLSPDELRRLLAAAADGPAWFPFFVEVALATGVRLSELSKRRLGDVQLERRRLLLEETKNGERRGVRLSKPAEAALKAWLAQRPDVGELLFPHTGSFHNRWREALGRAGIEDFHFHDLRHTAASYLAMQGATLAELAEFLGHKTLAMVKRYSHLAESHVDKVVDRMGGVIDQAKRTSTRPRVAGTERAPSARAARSRGTRRDTTAEDRR